MSESPNSLFDHQGGTAAPWYRRRELTDEQRRVFRETALRSGAAKAIALEAEPIDGWVASRPTLDPADLMPRVAPHLLPALSLFSGGGGLDLGFERAGFAHVASFDTLEAAGDTLRSNRPRWSVHSGHEGDVRGVDWRPFRDEVAALHGGPPCQPFSVAGRQRGHEDERNLLPEFLRAVRTVRPLAFVCENVAALAGPKFAPYLRDRFLGPLASDYQLTRLRLSAHEFGVPQLRQRVFFIGFRQARDMDRFRLPAATHRADHLTADQNVAMTATDRTKGVREALGLPDMGFDALCPTLRSTLTGPRHTTSILSSVSAQRAWARLQIWPNGVAKTRAAAARFPAENGHLRLSVAEVALLQGFPSWWRFEGAVYMALGQIGNSVAPPVGYQVARSVGRALGL